ncbi:MAG: arylamine N-acetyltransferase [Reichenbachiella sp.]
MLHIPFENLDNFLGQQVILDMKRVYKKIILHNRGGFCYELNGLFYYLLKALGYQVTIMSARVHSISRGLGPEFDHMTLLVKLENDFYLADVGYGISFKSPLIIKPDQLQMDFNSYYKIEKSVDDVFTVLSSNDSQSFIKEYDFDLTSRSLVEFIDMCEFHNRNKDSHLTKERFITKAFKEGQVTLTDTKLTITSLGKTEKYAIRNLDEFKVKLFEYFKIRYRAIV